VVIWCFALQLGLVLLQHLLPLWHQWLLRFLLLPPVMVVVLRIADMEMMALAPSLLLLVEMLLLLMVGVQLLVLVRVLLLLLLLLGMAVVADAGLLALVLLLQNAAYGHAATELPAGCLQGCNPS
jgi:hypothetical protein